MLICVKYQHYFEIPFETFTRKFDFGLIIETKHVADASILCQSCVCWNNSMWGVLYILKFTDSGECRVIQSIWANYEAELWLTSLLKVLNKKATRGGIFFINQHVELWNIISDHEDRDVCRLYVTEMCVYPMWQRCV